MKFFKPKLQPGQTQKKKVFAWIETRINNNTTVWLESYYSIEEYAEDDFGGFWIEIKRELI